MNKNIVLGIVGVLAFAIAGYRFFATAGPAVAPPEELTTYGLCFACGSDEMVVHPAEQRAPFACAACSTAAAVYPWWYCHECYRRFIPALNNETPPAPAPFVSCTGCGCRTVEQFEPGSEFQSPAGDVEPVGQRKKWEAAR